MTGQEGRTRWSHFNSRLYHCSRQISFSRKWERNQFSLYPALWILKYSLSLQQNKRQILGGFTERKIYFTPKQPTALHQHIFRGLKAHVLALAYPNSNNRFQFVAIWLQILYRAIPSCWAPLISRFLFSLKKKKHTPWKKPTTQLCLNQCKNILKNRY